MTIVLFFDGTVKQVYYIMAYIYIYICVCVCVCVCAYKCMWVCMCVHDMCIQTLHSVCVSVCLCVCLSTYAYICVYILYTDSRSVSDSDDEMDRVVMTRPDLQERPPQPPPVPVRPTRKQRGGGDGAAQGEAQK